MRSVMTDDIGTGDEHGYRERLRKKLVDLFLKEYSRRRDRGELLYRGKWIKPDEKLDFTEEIKKEHKGLFYVSLLFLDIGCFVAYILIRLLIILEFPS